jgi:hypothetical protein
MLSGTESGVPCDATAYDAPAYDATIDQPDVAFPSDELH